MSSEGVDPTLLKYGINLSILIYHAFTVIPTNWLKPLKFPISKATTVVQMSRILIKNKYLFDIQV